MVTDIKMNPIIILLYIIGTVETVNAIGMKLIHCFFVFMYLFISDIHIHTHIPMHIHMHIHIYICVCICIYVCILLSGVRENF